MDYGRGAARRYTWRRDLNSVREQQYARGPVSREWLSSPFNALIERSRAGEKNPWLRRRLELGPDQRDFPALVDFYEAGATDYLCLAFAFGEAGDPSHGTGVVFSFTTDRPGGFLAGEIHLLRSTLPGLSLLDSGAKRNALKKSGFERPFQARQSRLGMAS
jgi:adenylate cyclase